MTHDCGATDLRALPHERLADMAEAGGEILECYRLLRKGGGNIVGELLRGHDTFIEWEHYPPGDVYDNETHAQYYYHAHPAACRFVEHGHFHTFMRAPGMPEGASPVPFGQRDAAPVLDLLDIGSDGPLSHLVAISMDQFGYPLRLFTTNRWVTGETWYRAADVVRMLDGFVMDLAYPSLPVNIWITAMVRLFRPQIETLVAARDAAIARGHAAQPSDDVLEDRELEVTSALEISVEAQIAAIAEARHERLRSVQERL